MAECITCDIVSEYVTLANNFTQDLASTLLPGMWALFGAIVGIWIILHGYQFILAGKGDLDKFVREMIPVIIAAILLHGQGPTLVNSVYYAALNTMGAAAGLALSVGGGIDIASCASCGEDNTGLTDLVWTAEQGISQVFIVGNNIVAGASWLGTGLAILYAIILVLPYFIVLIVFFSQVVIAVFRVLMIAALSPFLMLGFAFGWGRQMAVSGIRTVLASFMVLFGCTAALAVMLYGVTGLDALTTEEVNWSRVGLDIDYYLLAVALGWMGSAFMTEATSIANSITGSVLSNSGLAVLTGGALGASYAATRAGTSLGGQGASSIYRGATYAAGYATGGASEGARRLIERFQNFNNGGKS